MNIGIIDADLIGKKKHRFPNLACMKISSYYKSIGNDVELLLSYDDIENYDRVFISKVFIDTSVPDGVIELPWVEYGGTGFFYDKAKPLPYNIEHSKPDYHLYDEFVELALSHGAKPKELEYYTDYSIGFTTRGCIRGCSFCVNKNYRQCFKHSPISEFLDKNRKYICLLDDNVFSCRDWKSIFEDLIATGKRFQFKQGLDERLLTDEKCDMLFNKSNWVGDIIFAFDNIKDKRLIEKKLKMIRRHTNKQVKFYTFCGYNHDNIGIYDNEFWAKDIADLFERIKILMKYGCLPYVMRYKDYELSPYKGIYITAARWCNQPSFFKKMSFAEYSKNAGMNNKMYSKYKMQFDKYLGDGGKKGSSWRYMEKFAEDYPDIANEYFNMKFEDINEL